LIKKKDELRKNKKEGEAAPAYYTSFSAEKEGKKKKKVNPHYTHLLTALGAAKRYHSSFTPSSLPFPASLETKDWGREEGKKKGVDDCSLILRCHGGREKRDRSALSCVVFDVTKGGPG